MIKKIITLTALSITLMGTISIPTVALTSNKLCPNCIANSEQKNKPELNQIKCDIKMLSSSKNLEILSEDEKKDLKEINTCIEQNADLSKSQFKKIMKMKDKVAKCILGEKDYDAFKELLKKDKDNCLSQEEKEKLNSYMTKLK